MHLCSVHAKAPSTRQLKKVVIHSSLSEVYSFAFLHICCLCPASQSVSNQYNADRSNLLDFISPRVVRYSLGHNSKTISLSLTAMGGHPTRSLPFRQH